MGKLLITIFLYVIQITLIVLTAKFYPILTQDRDNTIDYFRNEVTNLNGKLTV